MKRKILTLLLALVFVLSAIPAYTITSTAENGSVAIVDGDSIGLTTKYIQQTAIASNGTFDVRFVAILKNVDLAKCKAAGFQVTATQDSIEMFSKALESTVVFTSLNANTAGTMVSYTAEELGGDYIIALAITGIPGVVNNKNALVSFTVSPYITANTGETISGAARQVVFEGGKLYDDSSSWALEELPYYEGGAPAEAVFQSGKLLTDYTDKDAAYSKVMVVSDTTATEFEAYVTRLKAFGYTQTNRETLENNVYVTLKNDLAQVYTYYVDAKKTVHIVYDAISDSVNDISEPMTDEAVAEATENGKQAVFYQYGLNHNCQSHPDKPWDNGMLLVVKCADNSVIIIDGGSSNQADYGELNSFLHEITGIPEGERVTIAAWVLTHLHSDHFYGFKGFISQYHGQYTLKSICANVPYDIATAQVSGTVTAMETLATNLKSWYPELKEIQIHTGQKLQFGDVTLQALYTHEDSLNATTGASLLVDRDFNMTSTVFKVTANGMSMMVLGDAQKYTWDALVPTSADAYLTSVYTETTLKCDIVQVAHHALNGLSKVYQKIKASVYFIPQTLEGFECTADNHEDIKRDLLENDMFPSYAQGYNKDAPLDNDDDMIFFIGNFNLTVGVQAVDGKIVKVYPIATVTAGNDTETGWSDIIFLR